jgi:hypothetical protein
MVCNNKFETSTKGIWKGCNFGQKGNIKMMLISIKGKLSVHWFGEFASFVRQLMLVVVVFFFHYTNSYLRQCVMYF